MKRVWIVLAVLMLVLAGLSAAFALLLKRRIQGRAEFSSPAVLQLVLEGEVVEKFPADPFVAGVEGARYQLIDIVRALDAAGRDDRIRGIYLRVGYPGYGWAKAEEIRERLLRFRETGKFVYAYLTPTDELGYYVALAADSLYLLPDATLELNGFSVETPFILRLFEKLGVEAQVESVGAYKSAADLLRRDDMSDEEREVTQAILRERHALFVEAVAEARELDAEDFASALDAGLYLAADLAHLGLIDGELYESEVRALALARALDREPPQGRVEGATTPAAPRPEAPVPTAGQGAAPAVPAGGSAETEAEELLESDAADHFVDLEAYVSTLSSPARAGQRKIGLVYAIGAIAGGDDTVDPVFGRTMGSASMIEVLREAASEESLEAVVLRVDSPGGDAIASEEIWAQVEELRRLVPVVVSMSDVAGSGGYYIAAGADEIVAAPSTITGSIGVLGVIFNAEEAWDKLGVAWGSVRTNPAAEFPTSTRAMTDAERATFRRLIQDTYRSFVERVAEGRERSVEEIDAVAQGRIWSGTQARERSLVDRVGGLEAALETAKQLAEIDPSERVGLIIYPGEKSLLERLRDFVREPGASLAGKQAAGVMPGGVHAARVGGEFASALTGAALALRQGPGHPLAVMPFVPRIQ